MTDHLHVLAKLHFAVERNHHDPELYLDAATTITDAHSEIERLKVQLNERDALISNQRAEIGRLQAQAIY